MSDNRCLKYREDEEEDEQNDEECDKTPRPGKQPRVGAQKATGKDKRGGTKKARVLFADEECDDAITTIDTYKPLRVYAEGNYARTYESAFKNQPRKRIPQAGAYTEVGFGRVRAEFYDLEAEAKGPNVSFGSEASVVGVAAMARAEFGSISAKGGSVGVKLGLGVDTGGSFGENGMEVKVLGTGFSIGPTTSVSVLGSEVKVSCAVM